MRRLLRRRDHARIAGEVAAAAAVALPPAPPDTTAAAFFDVDNTMMRGASIYHFARGLATRGLFTSGDLVRFALGQAWFRVRGNENPEHIAKAKEMALAFVAGLKVDDVVRLGEEIYDEVMADRVWAGTRALAQAHLDAGQRVWLVTATPVELARVIAQRLGLTGALGTVAETEHGAYTGHLVGDLLHGAAKAEGIRALARREGLDLTRCSAYSDSANDLPMLALVGHPHAINPDSELRDHAKEQGWPIRDFRTGRKATMIGLPVAATAGAVAGGIAAGAALRKHYRSV
jgi:HAD superfamily hydrolase (TIGR01490 family)